MDDDANDTHEPEAYSWQALQELPINIDVGQEAQFHSIFTCPVSREQATESNPPMLLDMWTCFVQEQYAAHSTRQVEVQMLYCPHEIFWKRRRGVTHVTYNGSAMLLCLIKCTQYHVMYHKSI